MIRLSRVVIFLFCFPSFIVAQITISGVIVDQQTQLPVEYANIGMPEKNIGTIGDAQGKFSLFIPAEQMMDPIIITHVSYQTNTLPAKLYSNLTSIKVEMIPRVNDLTEFTFSGKDKIELGYRPQDDRAKGYFKADGLGMEGGCVIRNTDTVELSAFYMNILELPYDSMKFRLNFYSLKNSQPEVKLNKTNINFVLKKNKLGMFSLPIPNRLVVTGDFVCTLELIELFGEVAQGAHFTFSAIPDKKGLIFKKGLSMAKWEKIRKYSLCFWLAAKR